jgi:hypothetical protein
MYCNVGVRGAQALALPYFPPRQRWLWRRCAALKRWLKHRFALHFVRLDGLGEQVAAEGYHGYQWSLPGGWFGSTSARKDALAEDNSA